MMDPSMFSLSWFKLPAQRIDAIVDEIAAGSEPRAGFYALLTTSAMIACFGLVANSTAVIIGAMLVSPLMTPIFGIALGMLRGRPQLFWRAVLAEAGGVVFAIGASYLFGLIPILTEATPEILARTQPNLLDLLVAVFAGLAGAYALLDSRVSPALPGVAISTAIVPPLSTCGLCLATGSYQAAMGAILLFLANFVSILLVASIIFELAGVAQLPTWKSRRELLRRFGPTMLSFILMAVVLTHSLAKSIEERRVVRVIHDVLTNEVSQDAISLDNFQHRWDNGTLYVLATVRSPRYVRPNRVTELQDALQQRLQTPVELVVRGIVARDVASIGSDLTTHRTNFNGVFFDRELSDVERKERVATQVLSEELQNEPGFDLIDLQYGETIGGSFVVATVDALRVFRPAELDPLEKRIQDRLGESVDLIMRFATTQIVENDGPYLIEWTHEDSVAPERRAELNAFKEIIKREFAQLADVFPLAVHMNVQQNHWRALVEVEGPRPPRPEDVRALQEAIRYASEIPVEINVWFRGSVIVTNACYRSYDDFTKDTLRARMDSLPRVFRHRR